MEVYLVHPEKPVDRAVIVLQTAFGVDDYLQDVTQRIAARGFVALAPNLFHRHGIAALPFDRHIEAVSLVDATGIEDITVDIRAALDYVGARGIAAKRTAIVGFCFGGRAAFTAAATVPSLAAAVVFYGPGIASGSHAVLDRAASIHAPLMIHVGDDDPLIPIDDIRAIETELRSAGVDFEQHIYSDAGHAFASESRPQFYRPEQAEQAWHRTHAFLDNHLPVGP
ncbi:dienelactone hydrolase family protein [Mycolicibacterium septicum]|uniref:dienelactone hydrolase family protein n=1 Tax=Mycolicibacterium septicum TaxID=98668 RepID=UPI0023E1E31D|nr:dienelactone hydrolase family protein [Mycolicibacterium septicum]MDF3337110.1 dienelactone hydrolase family protein [Mycolicibacterium septicum]